jgi:hypothetical protein
MLLKVPHRKKYFLWKLRWPLLLMRPWSLNLDYTTFPFLYFGIWLAYPPNFYWISKYWQQSGLPTKKILFFPFNNLAIRAVTLTKIFLQSIGIVRFKILQLKVEKYHLILIFILHAMKYIFEAQYSPKRS